MHRFFILCYVVMYVNSNSIQLVKLLYCVLGYGSTVIVLKNVFLPAVSHSFQVIPRRISDDLRGLVRQ